jgi:hypothetical protein
VEGSLGNTRDGPTGNQSTGANIAARFEEIFDILDEMESYDAMPSEDLFDVLP